MSTLRKSLALVLLPLLLGGVVPLAGCKGETEKNPWEELGIPKDLYDQIVAENPGASSALIACLANLSLSNPVQARTVVQGNEGTREVYCSVLGSFQDLLVQLGPLLDTVAAQIPGGGAPGYTPALDANLILKSALKNILPRLNEIREGTTKIIARPEVKLSVPSLPLKIKVASLQKILGGGANLNIPENLTLDLKGVYDRSELHILGVLGAGVPGLVSFLSAHDLNINLSIVDLDFSKTGSIADYLVTKTSTLLTLKNGGTIQGDVKNLLLATLNFAAGTKDNAPGEDGLLAQVKRELKKESEVTGKEVIAFIDKNGNSEFDRGDLIRISFVAELFKQLGVTDQTGDFSNFLPEQGWQALTNIGRDLIGNLNDVVPAVKPLSRLHPWLEKENALNADLFNSVKNPDGTPYGPIPLPPDWIAINLKAYFDNPKGLRDLFPAIYDLGASAPPDYTRDYTRYDFAFSCELAYTAEEYATTGPTAALPADSTWRLLCGAKEGTGNMFLKPIFFRAPTEPTSTTNLSTADAPHFNSFVIKPATTASELTAPVLFSPITYATTDAPADLTQLPIPADGIGPERNPDGADGLLYIVFKDPTLGGILLVDPGPNPASTNPGGTPTDPGNQQSLNTVVAKFLKNYLKYIILLINSL